MKDEQPTDWSSHVRGLGRAQPQPLGQGMEGAVFGLGDGSVAKVWFRRKRL